MCWEWICKYFIDFVIKWKMLCSGWVLLCYCREMVVSNETFLISYVRSFFPFESLLCSPCSLALLYWWCHYSLCLLPLVIPMCDFVVRVGFSLHSPINVDLFINICKEGTCILWRELQEWSVCSGNMMVTLGSLLEELFRSQTCFSTIRSDTGL